MYNLSVRVIYKYLSAININNALKLDSVVGVLGCAFKFYNPDQKYKSGQK